MSSVTLWTRRDPFADFETLVRDVFGPVATRKTVRPFAFTPAAEVSRDGDDAVVRVEVPGVDVAKDVAVEVEGGRLVVRGERREQTNQTKDGRSFSEVRYGSFRRAFGLPEHVTADAVSASYDAGVLSVRVAGAYAAGEKRQIAIVSGAEQPVAIEQADGAESVDGAGEEKSAE